MGEIDAVGFNVLVQIGDGTYTGAVKEPNGGYVALYVAMRPKNAQTFKIRGNVSTPANVVLQLGALVGGSYSSIGCLIQGYTRVDEIKGITIDGISGTGAMPGTGKISYGLYVDKNSYAKTDIVCKNCYVGAAIYSYSEISGAIRFSGDFSYGFASGTHCRVSAYAYFIAPSKLWNTYVVITEFVSAVVSLATDMSNVTWAAGTKQYNVTLKSAYTDYGAGNPGESPGSADADCTIY
jgi:hypothetical protein